MHICLLVWPLCPQLATRRKTKHKLVQIDYKREREILILMSGPWELAEAAVRNFDDCSNDQVSDLKSLLSEALGLGDHKGLQVGKFYAMGDSISCIVKYSSSEGYFCIIFQDGRIVGNTIRLTELP